MSRFVELLESENRFFREQAVVKDSHATDAVASSVMPVFPARRPQRRRHVDETEHERGRFQ